ncbi:MAG: hypothetical protein L3J38_06820 [Thiomicrorhabdus sp.]|nr:hypothetical protein [Thiomicrorhabdus sp.]MCF6299118.1 hypothetical protein [Thiomicrorhabdus sp.]
MKNKWVKIILGVNLFALFVLMIVYPQHMIQPGKLIEPHMELTNDCFACHTPFIGSTSTKCIECHQVDEIGLKTTEGRLIPKEDNTIAFHQKLLEDDCVACHSDHQGVLPFRAVGLFSHELLALDVQEQCASCHSAPEDALHQKVEGNCAQCHSTDGWEPATFNHDEYFILDRDHNVECEVCHVNNDYNNYTCYGCHEHSRSNIREEHIEEGIRDYKDCVECHRSADEDEAERIWKKKRRDLRGH